MNTTHLCHTKNENGKKILRYDIPREPEERDINWYNKETLCSLSGFSNIKRGTIIYALMAVRLLYLVFVASRTTGGEFYFNIRPSAARKAEFLLKDYLAN
jgi:hypothetical protein